MSIRVYFDLWYGLPRRKEGRLPDWFTVLGDSDRPPREAGFEQSHRGRGSAVCGARHNFRVRLTL
jgi:hypothetical protein